MVYRKVPIVTTLITFGISSLLALVTFGGGGGGGLLLVVGHNFRGTKTMKQS